MIDKREARSLRTTLQLWNAALVLSVVGLFGGLTYFGARHARLAQVDTELQADAEVVAARLRPVRPSFGGFGPFGDRGGDHGEDRSGDRGRARGLIELPAEVAAPFAADPVNGPYFAVFRRGDAVALASPYAPDDVPAPAPDPSLIIDAGGGGFGGGQPSFEPAFAPYARQRGGLREMVASAPFGARVVVGRSLAPVRAELRTLLGWTLAGGAGVAGLGLLGGGLLARRAVRPITAMTVTASGITAANLSGRIDPAGASRELADLAGVLNGTFARLEGAFERQARFTADASHELRTPLSVIFSHAELALSRERPPAEYRAALETCLRASRRMRGLVESLLTLARADAGQLNLKTERFDLSDVAEESADLLKSLAAERGVGLGLDVDPAAVAGDAGRVGQCATNLIANAILYNRPGGRVDVAVRPEDGDAGPQAVLEVRDTGLGVAEADRPRLFERFYRADASRARGPVNGPASGPAGGGSGLGLAICKGIAEAHGGTITFRPNDGPGSTFTLRLPLAAPPAAVEIVARPIEAGAAV